MELNRQGCRLLSVWRHVWAPTLAGKFVQKCQGLMFVSPLDCEGDGHF